MIGESLPEVVGLFVLLFGIAERYGKIAGRIRWFFIAFGLQTIGTMYP